MAQAMDRSNPQHNLFHPDLVFANMVYGTTVLKKNMRQTLNNSRLTSITDLAVRGTAWYSLATRGLVMGGGVGGGVGRMVYCNSYSNC